MLGHKKKQLKLKHQHNVRCAKNELKKKCSLPKGLRLRRGAPRSLSRYPTRVYRRSRFPLFGPIGQLSPSCNASMRFTASRCATCARKISGPIAMQQIRPPHKNKPWKIIFNIKKNTSCKVQTSKPQHKPRRKPRRLVGTFSAPPLRYNFRSRLVASPKPIHQAKGKQDTILFPL